RARCGKWRNRRMRLARDFGLFGERLRGGFRRRWDARAVTIPRTTCGRRRRRRDALTVPTFALGFRIVVLRPSAVALPRGPSLGHSPPFSQFACVISSNLLWASL